MNQVRAFWYMIGLLFFVGSALILLSQFGFPAFGSFLGSACLLSAGVCLIRLLVGVFNDEGN
jgi:hypothetical protein